MAKWQNDTMLDQALDWVKNNMSTANTAKMVVCTGQPTTYIEANVTFALADVAMDSVDFVKANGDVSGRKLTVASKAAILVDTSGNADHVALIATINTVNTLLYVTTCTTQTLTAGNTLTVPAWDIELRDPT